MSEESAEDKMEAKHFPKPYASNAFDKLKVNFKDATFKESPYDPNSYNAPYNPDDLYKRKNSYDTYQDMYNDDQCYVCIQLKKDLVLGGGFEFVVKDEKDDVIKEELDKFFMEDMSVPFVEQLEGILSSYENGVSFTEKQFMKDDKGRLRLKCLKTRYPDSFLVDTDVYGNINEYIQRGFEGQNVKIQKHAIIHDINNNRYDNPYGRSDFRAAYNAWFGKMHIFRYYLTFIEKHGTPIAIGRYDHKKAEATAVTALFDSLKQLQNSTALVMPKEIEAELLEAKSDGEAFIKGINLLNTFIGRALLIPDLMGFTGGETSGGSFSLGKSQMDIFFKHINRRRERLEAVVNNHIIKPIVMFNHGDVENFPKFQLKPLQQEDANQFAKTWIDAVKGKLWEPNDDEINHLRGMLKFPTSDVIERVAATPSPFGPMDDKKPGDKGAKEEDIIDIDEDEKSKNDKRENSKRYDSNGELLNTPGADFSEDYDSKMDYAKVEKHLDNMLDKGMDRVDPIVDEILESIIEQIDKKKIISNKKIDRIKDIKVRGLKNLNESIKDTLLDNFTSSKTIAMDELIKANNKLNNFAKNSLTSEEFLKLLQDETFDYVGDLQDNLSKVAKVEVVAGIKDGKTVDEVAAAIKESGRRASIISIERYYRTKLTETMNQGRIEFFTESGIVHGYQYSAIMDSRTTAVCSGLHGKKFAANSDGPAFGTPIPPLHFNCRSILVPITKNESFNKSRSVGVGDENIPIDDFISENIGKGFPVG